MHSNASVECLNSWFESKTFVILEILEHKNLRVHITELPMEEQYISMKDQKAK